MGHCLMLCGAGQSKNKQILIWQELLDCIETVSVDGVDGKEIDDSNVDVNICGIGNDERSVKVVVITYHWCCQRGILLIAN